MNLTQKNSLKKMIYVCGQLMRNKTFRIPLLITLLCSYGFFVTHYAVGIDDTAMGRYFTEGLAPVEGRWVIFLLNKIIPLITFTPFLTDFLGVLFLTVFAVMFCAIWSILSDGRMKPWMLSLVACLIVSNPISSEVFVYYLHNGVGIGYCITLFAACLLCGYALDIRLNKWYRVLEAAILLTISIGLYESFEVVFAILTLGILLLTMWYKRDSVSCKRFCFVIVTMLLVMVLAIVLRSLVVDGIAALWGFEKGQERSVYLGWMLKSGAIATIRSYLQYILLLFGLNGIFYVGIRFYVISEIVLLVFFVVESIKQRNIKMLIAVFMLEVIPWSLVFVTGRVPLYRSCQYIPVMVGMAGGVILQFCGEIKDNSKEISGPHIRMVLRRGGQIVLGITLGIVIYTQSFDSNRWYYLDYLKYQDDVKTCDAIYNVLRSKYSADKPVVFLGMHETSTEVVRQTQAAYESKEYQIFHWFAQRWVDPSVLEPYENDTGYKYGQSAASSTLAWALSSFGDGDAELHRFMQMLGYDLMQGDATVVAQAVEKNNQIKLPSWPQDGCILETEDYIIVNIEGR